jgi:beta-N-acetylhexosaminidase
MENHILMDLEGTTLTKNEQALLQHPKIGGVVLFARNYTNKAQLRKLTRQIKAISNDFLIAVDHEGGRVQRFRDEFTKVPPAGEFGKLYDTSPSIAISEAKRYASWVANELAEVGVNVNFAPVLDVNYGLGTIIGDRSFHKEPAIVAEFASAYIEAYTQKNVMLVGKHFPGHGGVIADTHIENARDTRSFNIIAENDLLPFKKSIELGIGGIMASHVVYENVDSIPATFSTTWLKNILREKLNFAGYIFSDDLNMYAAGVAGDIKVRASAAINAGCDYILICNNRAGLLQALDE